ncbi:MAG: helix-turn-helix domain-containing protein, partial [Enterococcus sp.]
DEYKEQASLEEFIRKLSKNEQLLFEQLQEEQPITRQQLCQIIWQGDESKSRKSQLSYIAKKVNKKLAAYNYTDKRIKTYWRKGYILQ